MMSYTVQFTEPAWASVHAQFSYIAIEKKSPLNGKRWLRRLLAATESLSMLPRRFGIDTDFSAELGTDVYRMVFERTYLVYHTVHDDLGLVQSRFFSPWGAGRHPRPLSG
jgi:plasmid stabilization system protein ParE